MTLPTEIWNKVFTFLSIDDQKKVSLVSKQFCDISNIELLKNLYLDCSHITTSEVDEYLRIELEKRVLVKRLILLDDLSKSKELVACKVSVLILAM